MIGWRILACFLLTIPGVSAQQASGPDVFLDEVKKNYVEKIDKAIEEKDWRALFNHYEYGRRHYSKKVVALKEKGELGEMRWVGLGDYLIRRLSGLPGEAYEVYRFQKDGEARARFEAARKERDRRALATAVEEYFFATGADAAMNELANAAFDAGHSEEAVFAWDRLLRYYPDSKIPRTVTAARIAHACVASGNESALKELIKRVEGGKIEGTVAVAGSERKLSRWLAELAVAPPVPEASTVKLPYAVGFEARTRRQVDGVRNHIKRWTYDFDLDQGAPISAKAPAMTARERAIWNRMRGQVQPPIQYPLFPAYALLRGKEYLIFTDGTRTLAVDPARVKGVSATAGVYWKYPSAGRVLPAGMTATGRSSALKAKPYIGVTIEGEHAYVTMYSVPDAREGAVEGQGAVFQGVTSVKCFHVPTGRKVWDTDEGTPFEEIKDLKFFDQSFSFCGAPLVRGERIYLGVCTSPIGEPEGRVICLDRRTGRPLWSTFLSSVMAGTNWRFGVQKTSVVYQTLLSERGGTVYASTNLGVVAALSGETGRIQWLSKYRRTLTTVARRGTTGFTREANRPVTWGGRLYVLPQDRVKLLIFDRISGRPIETPKVTMTSKDFDWKDVNHLLGIVAVTPRRGGLKQWMVLTGGGSRVLDLDRFHAYALAASNTRGAGRGTIHGGRVYLSGGSGGGKTGGLGLYDQVTWKNLEQSDWKGPNESGNLLVAGTHLAVATNKVAVYTDVETLRGRFVRRIYQSPPNAEALLEFGDTMRENGLWEEAAEAYLGYIRAAEGDPAHEARRTKVRNELHSIFLSRGKAAEATHPEKAVEFYRFAKEFAYDEKTRSEATEKMAKTYERLKRWKEAVSQYQEIIEKARTVYHRETENVSKLWEHARASIERIVGDVPDAYQEVEKRAAAALREAAAKGGEALRDVMDRFPNSRQARDAWKRLAEILEKDGQLEKLRALYGEFKDRFNLDPDFDVRKKILELLDKIGDAPRLRYELDRFGREFGDRPMDLGGRTVRAYVALRLKGLAPAARDEGETRPLRKTLEMEAPVTVSDPHATAANPVPLRPRGVEPPGFGPELELFARGSTIELWDLNQPKRIWKAAHPGAYLGAVFMEAPEDAPGVRVTSFKPGSPAAEAGMKSDDVLLSVGGVEVTASSLSDRLAVLPSGVDVQLVVQRGDAVIRLSVKPSDHPEGLRPAVVGAAFTSDYAVAVAWEDQVVSLDLATGATRWTFRELRDRFRIEYFHATDGRLFVYEAASPDRDRDPFRAHEAKTQQARRTFTVDAHTRLICLSDSTGRVRWAKAFQGDLTGARAQVQVEFFGAYLSEDVFFLHRMTRGGRPEWVLWQLASSDGGLVDGGVGRRTLGRILAHAVNEEKGVFYYVEDGDGSGRTRYLRSLPLTPVAKARAKVDVALHLPKYMPRPYGRCSLAVDSDYVCLIVQPHQVSVPYRIWVFKADGGAEYRSIDLLPNRTLPFNQATGPLLDRDGLLYVYNVPKSEVVSGQPPRRAYLTAFKIGGNVDETPGLVAWDAVAPVLANDPTLSWSVLDGPAGVVAFSSPRAAAPGDSTAGPLALLYDKGREGYICHKPIGLIPGAGSVIRWRGRLYVGTPKGLWVFE